ncbi:kinase-like protein [Thelephora ganbajun]|uniref:Kinase-like protein n=1 Tax=Thelephora ganbajun TaxID=370292 RepID=A0ACB6Z7Z5_THEGA|nr:kinase-like protein [Thelephora ganbajun]
MSLPMNQNSFVKEVLLQSKRPISRLHDIHRSQDDGEEREGLVVGASPVPRSLHHPSPLSQLEAESLPISDLDGMALLQRCTQMAQELSSSLLSSCPSLSPEDIELTSERPVSAGGFADIWGAMHDGRKVVLKSYRCYMSFDVAQVVTRFCNEVYAYILLPRTDVLLVGVYSTHTHPFGLVYEYMDNLDLRQYLRSEPNVGRLKLLTDIARCLNCLHDLDIVHSNLRTTNILIDKYGVPRIAGLGNVRVLPHSTARTAEGGTSDNQLSCNLSPEVTRLGMSPNVTEVIRHTKASDMYAFGVTAFEVLTGRPPFHEMTEISATYLMLSGSRPPRPDHHKVSDSVWRMIQSCWNPVASRRMPIGEVVTLLEAELSRTPTPYVWRPCWNVLNC